MPEIFRRASHALVLTLPLLLAACNDTGWPARDPVVVNDPDADSLRVYPPLAHALAGEPLVVQVHGLKTVYDCSRLLEFAATTSDSATVTRFSVTARVEWPAVPDCPLVPGLDTVVPAVAPAAGRMLVLRAPRGRGTDTVTVIAGTALTVDFLHEGSRTDTLTTVGRFTFRDSTAGHPRRVLYADSLAACETLQAAVYTRRGRDTLALRHRILSATPALPAETFPACAGVHADSVEAVEDLYGWPATP